MRWRWRCGRNSAPTDPAVVAVTSTALDAALALLLVSAAVVTVSTAGQPSFDDAEVATRADESLETLATATTAVNYTLAPGAERPGETTVEFGRTSGPEFRRTAHGTYAELLARSALATLELDGERVTHTGADFRWAVEDATLATVASDVQVAAVWRPYPDPVVQSRLVVGATPPPGATVHAASLTVPSGYPAARERAVDAADSTGFEGVAQVVAARVVAGTFPPRQAAVALHGDYPVAPLVANRYARFAALAGTNVTVSVRAGDVRGANDALAAALADRIETDLRSRYKNPARAASDVRIDRVRIVVRVWSA